MVKVIENKNRKLEELERILRSVLQLSRSAYKLSTVHKNGSVTVRFRGGRFEAAEQFSNHLTGAGVACEHCSAFNVSVDLNSLSF